MTGQPRSRERFVPPWVAHGAWALALVGVGYGLHHVVKLARHALTLYERGYVDGLAHEPMASRRGPAEADPDTDPE